MTDFIHCKKCGNPYLPGEASFCPKCGTPLSQMVKPADEIKQLENEPKPYEALRFTSGVIIFFGWIVIILGWLIALLWFTYSNDGYYANAENPDTWTNYLPFIYGFASTIFGAMTIGMGQLLVVILDIRNDMHTTMRLVRRFGLIMSEEQ